MGLWAALEKSLKNSHGQTVAFKALSCGPSKASKISLIHRKIDKSVEKVYNLALNMTF
jgi:hypothetical protein